MKTHTLAWLVGRSMVVDGELRRLQARHGFTLGNPAALADRPRFEGAPPVEVVLQGPNLTDMEREELEAESGHLPLRFDAGRIALRLLDGLEAIGMKVQVREVAYPEIAPAYAGLRAHARLDVGIVVARPALAGTRASHLGLHGRRRKSLTMEGSL